MIPVPEQIWVATTPVDFRRGIDGLAAWVERELEKPPLSGQMFVFFNRDRTGIKLLMWHHGGFILVFKRLERGRFRLPPTDRLTAAELMAALEGLDLTNSRRLPRWNPSSSRDNRTERG